MAEGFHFMFGICEMIFLLPVALTLEMVEVPKVQVTPLGVTDTSKTCIAGHTGKLMPINELGKTISNNLPGWILCWASLNCLKHFHIQRLESTLRIM